MSWEVPSPLQSSSLARARNNFPFPPLTLQFPASECLSFLSPHLGHPANKWDLLFFSPTRCSNLPYGGGIFLASLRDFSLALGGKVHTTPFSQNKLLYCWAIENCWQTLRILAPQPSLQPQRDKMWKRWKSRLYLDGKCFPLGFEPST